MFVVKRSSHNPLLVPYHEHHFESSAVFNMSVVMRGKKYIGFYRAMSHPDPLENPQTMSVVGKTESRDGIHFDKRTAFVEPVEPWEKYGCEDPRATFFEGHYYIFYTALGGFPFGADNVKSAVAVSKDLKKISARHLCTPFNSKAMTLFPKRIDGKIVFLITVDPDSNHARIAVGFADKIEDLWSPDYWKKWYAEIDIHVLDLKRTQYDHLEIGAPPLETKNGWLLIYSYIQNYFPNPERAEPTFGTEAAILDFKNPHNIVGRTKGSLLSPEELYERRGAVSEIVFPSGAIIEKNILRIYYGGADNVVCRASVTLVDLLKTMQLKTPDRDPFVRPPFNPIIAPIPSHAWESLATFNPGALFIAGKTYIFYRAMSQNNTSTIGLAISSDNLTIDERLSAPIYAPREDFEMKKKENGNSGCEDPRVMLIGDKIYMCYTAYDGVHAPRVAVTFILLSDFLKRNFVWQKPVLITPENVDDKDSCILNEKINGKWLIFHRIGTDICADYVDSLDFEKVKIDKCISVLGPRTGMWDSAKVGISAPPIKTKHGWLLFYHGVSKRHSTYRIGAVLLDLKDPTLVLSRSTDPVFEPTEDYEKVGIVSNVVFPCGAVVRGEKVYIYYGGADKVVGVAQCKLSDIVEPLVRGAKLG
jgi:predicted GH43/DUF377 family glycosyl hydrolase